MSNLQRTLTIPIKVGKVERNYVINFPTVGQYINVESRKAQLTIPKGLSFDQSTQYLNLIRQRTLASNMALDFVDMIAWFETCIPDLMKNTVGELQNIEQLDIFDAQPLVEAYKKHFLPWKTAWEKIFHGIVEEVKEEETKAE